MDTKDGRITAVEAHKFRDEEHTWHHQALCPICGTLNLITFWCWNPEDPDYLLGDGELLWGGNLFPDEDVLPKYRSVRCKHLVSAKPTYVKEAHRMVDFYFERPESCAMPPGPRGKYGLGI